MKIKMLVMDVDGTLTDGKIYIGANGEMMKAFNVKDGYGIAHLREEGIIPVIITGRESKIVSERARELKIVELYQGVPNKLEQLKVILEKFGYAPEEVAYIGDDLNDMQCIEYCGLSACPKDALSAVKEHVDYVSAEIGGNGAVRDFITHIYDCNNS